MQASDLPRPVREALLKQVEKQVGREQYRELVDRIGEEELLEQVIRAAETAGEAPKPKKKRDILWTVAFWVIVAACVLPIFAGEWRGLWVLFAIMAPGFFGWLFGRIAEWWRSIMPRI